MSQYKVGDVAALFPKPAEPKTQSGKKIQSLFEEFYKKPIKNVKKQNQVNNEEKQAEDVTHKEMSEIAKEKQPNKVKRKFQNTNSEENTGDQVAKKQRSEPAAAKAPFPRSKKGKNSNNPSYLSKSKDPNFYIDSHGDEDLFPSKKGKKEEESSEDLNNKLKEERIKKRKEKKAARKLAKAQETNEIPDFLRLPPDEIMENSKSVFRMKKQRVIPSCKEVFENDEQKPNVVDTDGLQKPPNQKDHGSADSEERLSRTLFVGNLPLSTNKKDLIKLFSKFGTVENCRLRGTISQKPSMPKQLAEIKGKYHKGLNSRIAYVVLKERKNAIEALSLSGTTIDGHHVVVDRAAASGEQKKYDEKRSIFVGNLPFNIKDDTLWNTFLPCGSVEFVRVIRDKETGAGKGFGYVSFQKIQGKEKALAITDLEIEGRRLRIQSVQGERRQRGPQTSFPFRGIGKQIAKKEKMKNANSRKTIKKLMNRGKQQHQKKKIAGIFKKFSKN